MGLGALINAVHGQSEEPLSEKAQLKAEKKARKDSIREAKVAAGEGLISPLVAPGYTPELGGLVAVGGLWSFKTNKSDTIIQRSSVPFTFALTTTGAKVLQIRPTTFWLQDRLRITGEFWYKDMPDNYWGVGSDAALETPKSDSTTAYDREWFWLMPQFLYQFRKNYFVGLTLDYNYTKGSKPSEGVSEDPDYIAYNDRPLNSGIGLILRYDSRDVPVNPWEGIFVDLQANFYTTALGGDNNYQVFQADYRQYFNLGKTAQTLALWVKSRIGTGDVPYGEMGQLGNPFDLRGYTWGRFRDKSLFFIIPEYRQMFYNQKSGSYKHGIVAWIGTGTVWNFDDADNGQGLDWLPNLGLGYRLEVQPRMNIRLDIGIGRETSGIYFNFNEAF